MNLDIIIRLHHLWRAYIVHLCVICNTNRFHSFIFRLCIMIVHTLKMCTGDTGPEQSLVLLLSVLTKFVGIKVVEEIFIPIPSKGSNLATQTVYCIILDVETIWEVGATSPLQLKSQTRFAQMNNK